MSRSLSNGSRNSILSDIGEASRWSVGRRVTGMGRRGTRVGAGKGIPGWGQKRSTGVEQEED